MSKSVFFASLAQSFDDSFTYKVHYSHNNHDGDIVIIKVDDYKLACKFGGNAWGVTRPQGLATILFPDLTYIGNAALSYFCTYSTDLESVSFPELEEIGQCGMYCGFQHNTKLKSISFPKLKKLSGMYNSLNSVCAYCTNLEVVNLDSLTNLTSNALCSAFQNCTKLFLCISFFNKRTTVHS